MRITNCENNAQNNDTLARVGTITTIRRKERNTSDTFTFDSSLSRLSLEDFLKT